MHALEGKMRPVHGGAVGLVGLVGLSLTLATSATWAAEPVTFSDQIVRIFQGHGQECHRPGGVSPFALTSYLEAYPWGQHILESMPPRKPVLGYGEFCDARRLSPADRDLITRWVAADGPEGDLAGLPPPRQFPSSWTLTRCASPSSASRWIASG